MTVVQRALFRCLLVALVTVLALIATAPSESEPSPVTTPSTTPPVIYQGSAP